jgi:hypothetical protein
MDPLPPDRKWRAITFATLLLAPACWSVLAGVVTIAADDGEGGLANPEAAIALGVALIPFVFTVLAFASEHPRAPGAVVKAMGLAVVVGIPASALAADAVTGLVAGIGAGGVVALRADVVHSMKLRAWAVLAASLYAFVMVRVAGPVVLLAAPVFPFTVLGLADHLAERRDERDAAAAG